MRWREVVDFLSHPERYARAGAIGPRGVLMVGPPGTGKTLMARAVAGEAGVPFFALTGSSFVELFVGVGASRVRDLFADARKRAPSIIFIDEIDAIGQRRGGSHRLQRRARTDPQPAPGRDGRFRPHDWRRRHGGHEPTGGPRPSPAAARAVSTVRWRSPPQSGRAGRHFEGARRGQAPWPRRRLRRRRPGHARILRGGSGQPHQRGGHRRRPRRPGRHLRRDIDEARDRIILGRRDASNVLLPEEKHSVAVHEAGHALVALLSKHADPVAKITILPAGRALGVTEQLPVDERHLYAESYLLDSLAIRLGGRASEILVIGEASTGAANDLSGATELAVNMVTGLGPVPPARPDRLRIGPAGLFGRAPAGPGAALCRRHPAGHRPGGQPPAVRGRGQGTRTPEENRDALDAVIAALLEKETISGDELTEIVNRVRGAGNGRAVGVVTPS